MSSSPSDIVGSIESQDGAPSVRDLREWLDSLRTEWDVVTAYVSELRKLLAPEDVETAMAVCGLDPSALAEAQAEERTEAQEVSRVEEIETSAPSSDSASTTPGASPIPSLIADLEGADESTINRRLVEVLALLQQNLETLATDAKRQVNVPAEVTQAIAKEVAGRVQETLGPGGADQKSGSEENVGSYWAGGGSDDSFRRIPLDDIESVIDELIRNQ